MPSCKYLVSPWEALTGSLLDLLFPPRCVVCGKVGTWLCASCAPALPWLDGPTCIRCGVPIQKGQLCPQCQQNPPRLEAIRSVFLFDGPLRDAIHRLKYRHGHSLAQPLGSLMADYWGTRGQPVDVIVPVPLHLSRLRRRGYNQAALVACEFGRQMGIPVDEQALQRVRNTASQMRLNAAERRRNVRGAFRSLNGHIQGKKALLIDDVCTTGATLEACADALREGGATEVWALTLARAP